MVNISENNFDTIILLNVGLERGNFKQGGLIFCGEGNDYGFLDYFDYYDVVKNLCAYQYYHRMDFFATYTCNQRKSFGANNRNNCVHTGRWEKFFPG